MSSQMSFDDIMNPAAGMAERDAAIAQVEANANGQWKEAAFAAVERVCRQKQTFVVDDVWIEFHRSDGIEQAEYGTHERRAMGAVMKRAERVGLCENTGQYRVSARKTCHRNPRSLWRSKVAS